MIASNANEKAGTIDALLRSARWGLGGFGAAAIGIGSMGSVQPLAVLAGIVLGVVALGALMFSLRHYTWLWWLCWFVPLVPVFPVLEHIRVGVISLGSVMFAYLLAAALMFGALAAAGDRFRKWVGVSVSSRGDR